MRTNYSINTFIFVIYYDRFLISDVGNKINIISQITIKEPSTSNSLSGVFKAPQSDCQYKQVSSSSNSYSREDFDNWSEDKSSGSEYLPSDDNGIESDVECDRNIIAPMKEPQIVLNDPEKLPESRITTVSCNTEKLTESGINISASRKALSSGKRIRNKGHSCYFCHKIIQNSARHLEVVHGNEMEVAKLLAMPKNSKARRDGFVALSRSADFYHNVEVLSSKRGELILVRRPTENELKCNKFSDYGPCPHCLGFMLKAHLWHHIKNNCTSKRNDQQNSKLIIAESNAILNNTFGAEFSTNFVFNISSKLRDDIVGEYCKNDNMILQFGAMQFEKYGCTQSELIRQSMRQLGRFTLKMREMDNSKNRLSDYLFPEKFDQIIQAVKLLCVTHQSIDKRPQFDVPSLALKIGYALKKCASIKRGISLKGGNLKGNETLLSFLSLMDLEWNVRISSNALATLYNRKMNATQLLPLTSDLMKLNHYIDENMKTNRKLLSQNPLIKYWKLLASFCLSKVILFNKRRSGEASRMKIVDFRSRPKWSEQCTEELKNSFTDIENTLANQLTVVDIVGKRGRRVPVLLTCDVKDCIEILIETRNTVGIAENNPFVFARTEKSVLSIRGNDCLRKCSLEAGLERPQNISSTKLRKYIATVCQVLNLSENEHDWLARHLGHDIRVHRDFYRLHESAVELTKVSRLLMVVDQGQVNKFAGKKLEDINLIGKYFEF